MKSLQLKQAATACHRGARGLATTSATSSLGSRLRRFVSGPHKRQQQITQGPQRSSLASSSSEAASSRSQPTTSPPEVSPPKELDAAQRQAAIQRWKEKKKQIHNTTRAQNNHLKYGSVSYKGKTKEVSGSNSDQPSTGPLFESAAKQSILRKSELWKELDGLDAQLALLSSKASIIAQKLKAIELSNRKDQDQTTESTESAWGPDRLAPPGIGKVAEEWSASAEDVKPPAQPKSSDKASKESFTRLLRGDDLVASSKLQQRDGRGRLLPGASYQGPFQEDQKKWKESIYGCLSPKDVPIDKVPPLREMEVARLAHGLDRVLFNPGVYWLRDPRSGIYNFDPRIKDILDVDLFDYGALPPYITSSKDPELAKLTRQAGKKYCGSTSSMTALLSQCYFLISGWRNPDTSGFSAPFANLPGGFSVGAKLPASITLNYKDGFYAIDADKASSGEVENNNYVLTSLGKSMEKMLTSTPEEYAKYMRINSWKLSEEERSKPEAYHYASTSKMMMRSQLDCHDDRLPRKTFDLKTRASVGIRNDRANYVEGSGYQIRRATGALESFEREYYDMIRAAFLKYNFQARIGHMDGIFVAYHTTSTIFGFQYIPVEEMNERLFGSQEMADQAFKLSLGMMESILEAATSMFPEKTLKITVEAREKGDGPMSLYVEPVEDDSSSQDQSKGSTAPDTDVTTDVRTEASAVEGASKDLGSTASSPRRSIVQLDVTVDRYLDGGLVQGPIDFTVLPGRSVDPMTDDEIERRLRQSLPEVRWEIDYSISPRPDLTENKIRANLTSVRQKQSALSSLILPNVEALNEREQYRTEELSKNPEALKRFLEERASGAAAGMPLAPGQKSAESISTDPSSKTPSSSSTSPTASISQDLHASDPLSPASSTSSRRKEVEARFIRMRNIRTLRLRELARLGAKDAKENLKLDKQILFQPRS